MKRTISGLVALYSSDYDQLAKIRIGEEVKASISRPRNYKFHKKYMALINLCFENQDHYSDIQTFRYILQMKAGFFEIVETHEGKKVFFPKSISFAKMEENEFQEVYNKVLDVVLKFLGIDNEQFESEIINFM